MARIASAKDALQLGAIVAFTALVSYAAPRALTFIHVIESRIADLRIATLSPTEIQHPDIVIVTVTEDTLATLPYRSPLDRRFLAGVLRQLMARDVAAIGLDILFDQPTEPDKDAELRAVLRGAKVPIVAAWADESFDLTEKQVRFLEQYLEGITRGFVGVEPDSEDGTVRRVFTRKKSDGVDVPGMAAVLAAGRGIEVPGDTITVAYRWMADPGIPPFKVFPAHMVRILPKAWFAGKVVLIGADMPLTDRFYTPVTIARGEGATIPGVFIHAHALAQLLDGRRPPEAPLGAEAALVIALALAGLLIAMLDIVVPAKIVADVVVLVALWVGGFALFDSHAVLVPLITPSLSLVFSSSVATAYLGRRERRQKRHLRRAFSRYISPAVVAEIAADPSKLTLGGERREVTFIFTDIADFTGLMEKTEPTVILPALNDYLDGMCRIVLEHDGTMDKIVGDAVVSFFGAPSDQPDHAARAVNCALAQDAFARAYAQEQQALGVDFGGTRIGVNTGMAVVGNFGGESFFDYTAHGDTVNTAARMESVNKHLGTTVCVAGATAERCPDVAFRPVGTLVLKGKVKGVEAFEPLSPEQAGSPATAAYMEAFELLRNEDPAAATALDRLLQICPDDKLAALHARRLADGEKGITIVLKEK